MNNKINELTMIASLLVEVNRIKEENEDRELFFRGESKYHEDINPSIYRNGFIKYEDEIFKEYILRNPDEFINEKSTFEKLVKMQHYKLPTRLLDITSNPLIALYFAVGLEENEHNINEDGHFIVLAIKKDKIKYYDSDTVSVISNICRRPVNGLNISSYVKSDSEGDEVFLTKFNDKSNNDIQYLLHEIKEEKPYFKDVIRKEHLESVICVKPLLKNRRIIKQDGAFLLFGIKGTKENCSQINDKDGISVYRLKIPYSNKKSIKGELNTLGITKDKVYPELDTTSEYLKSIYQEKIINEKNKRLIEEIVNKANLQSFHEEVEILIKIAGDYKFRISVRSDCSQSVTEWNNNLIRIPIVDNSENGLPVLWSLLHELGHVKDGAPETSLNSEWLERENRAWENAWEIIETKCKNLIKFADGFQRYKKECLKTYCGNSSNDSPVPISKRE